jgi:hypothetical protein
VELSGSDRLVFDGAQWLAELPAVEPGAAQRRAELEMRLERRDDLVERVQVLAVLIDELRGGPRLRLADSAALLEPPGGGVEVEPADVEPVDDQPPSRRDQLAEPTAGILERVDVVEGDDRDRGRERLGGLATSTRATA